MTDVSANPVLAALDALSLPPPAGKPNLLGTDLEELARFAVAAGEPRFRGEQIFSGLYQKAATSFSELSNLPKRLRQQLEEVFTLARPSIDARQVSGDGTRKYRFVAADGLAFESVYIPEVAKGSSTNTLCISSQTGCAVGCKFCYTASLKRNRNLAAGEILGQVLAAQRDLAPLGAGARLTNIVFMGMGEPLLNYKEVVRAARLLIDPKAFGFSSRRVTISTSGIVPRIYELGRDLPTQLAISLNATTDEVRTRIMPINKKWPLAELIAALRAHPLPPRRRITVEYVMLKDVNDSLEDAKRLVKLLTGIPVKVNLLPLNVHDRTEFDTPEPERVQRFQDALHAAGVQAHVRTPRGRDIAAACGQLGETVVQGLRGAPSTDA
jgi:23S rRNA (adenine2503-C2)-methyltransferase